MPRIGDILPCMCDAIRKSSESCHGAPRPDELCPVCQERLDKVTENKPTAVTVKKIKLPGPQPWESGDREDRIMDLAGWLSDIVADSELAGGLFTREEIKDINLVARRLLRETMRL